MTASAIELARRLVEVRDAMRALWGKEYDRIVGGFKDMLRAEMVRIKTANPVEGAISLCKATNAEGGAIMAIMAAAHDLTENIKADNGKDEKNNDNGK